jgi:hypothetical protein
MSAQSFTTCVPLRCRSLLRAYVIPSLRSHGKSEIIPPTQDSICQPVSLCLAPGLPDGFFSDQKSQFGYILEGFGMGNVTLYSWSFGIF